MNVGLYFTSQKLYTYFKKKDIIIIFALFAFYKLVELIKKSNNILLKALKIMQKLRIMKKYLILCNILS